MSRPTKNRPLALMAGVALLVIQASSLPAHAEAPDPAESLRALFEKKTSAEPAAKDTSAASVKPAAEGAKNDGPLPIIPAGVEKTVPPAAPDAPQHDANSAVPPAAPAAEAQVKPATTGISTAPVATSVSIPSAPPLVPSAPAANAGTAAPLPRVPAPDDATLQDISNIKGEISLLTLQVQREKLLKELHQTQAPEKPAAEQPVQHPAAADTANSAPSAAARTGRIELPSVIEISGSSGRLSATISSTEGGEVHARKGQRVPGGFRVRDIDTQGVLFEREGGGGQNWYVGVGIQTRQNRADNGPQPAGMTPIPLQ